MLKTFCKKLFARCLAVVDRLNGYVALFKVCVQFLLKGSNLMLIGRACALKFSNLLLKFRVFQLQISNIIAEYQIGRLARKIKSL